MTFENDIEYIMRPELAFRRNGLKRSLGEFIIIIIGLMTESLSSTECVRGASTPGLRPKEYLTHCGLERLNQLSYHSLQLELRVPAWLQAT